MADKTIPSGKSPSDPSQAADPARPARPPGKKPGFDPASLRGGKLTGGKGPAPGGGKRMAIPGKSRGR